MANNLIIVYQYFVHYLNKLIEYSSFVQRVLGLHRKKFGYLPTFQSEIFANDLFIKYALTIFKSDRFRLFDIGSLSWRPTEFVEILVTEIPGSWSVSETVLRKKVILDIHDTR